MKAIIKTEDKLGSTSYNPNYAQRRKMLQTLNRKAKRPLTKDEFEQFLMVQRLRHGDVRDGDMKKKDLCKVANISTTSVTKLVNDQNVNTEILEKICDALQCDISDIVEVIHPNTEQKETEE